MGEFVGGFAHPGRAGSGVRLIDPAPERGPEDGGLARGLAVDLAPVRVNAVRSGAVRTPLWDAIPEPQRAAVFDNLTQRALTGSIGEPQQIAAAHLYLMENHFVTGTVLTVDGGLILTGS